MVFPSQFRWPWIFLNLWVVIDCTLFFFPFPPRNNPRIITLLQLQSLSNSLPQKWQSQARHSHPPPLSSPLPISPIHFSPQSQPLLLSFLASTSNRHFLYSIINSRTTPFLCFQELGKTCLSIMANGFQSRISAIVEEPAFCSTRRRFVDLMELVTLRDCILCS